MRTTLALRAVAAPLTGLAALLLTLSCTPTTPKTGPRGGPPHSRDKPVGLPASAIWSI